jgi:hypothetical protein
LAATAHVSDCFFDADFFATSVIHPPDILGWYRDGTQMLSECYADTDPVVTCRNTIYDSTCTAVNEDYFQRSVKANIILILKFWAFEHTSEMM